MERSHPSDLPLIIFGNKRTQGTWAGAWKRVSVPKFSSTHIYQTGPKARRGGSWGGIRNITDTRRHSASGARIAPECRLLSGHIRSFHLHLGFPLHVVKLVQQQSRQASLLFVVLHAWAQCSETGTESNHGSFKFSTASDLRPQLPNLKTTQGMQ